MRPIFIDFEASSLAPDSWPIEVGLAWIEGGDIRSTSKLIRPDPEWPADAWSPASAAIHGIPRSALDSAEPAFRVARWAIEMIGDRTLVSDAPEWDQRWLDRLLSVEESWPRPTIRDFDAMAARRFKLPALDRVYERLDRLPTPHRAEADASRLARAWLAGIESGPSE